MSDRGEQRQQSSTNGKLFNKKDISKVLFNDPTTDLLSVLNPILHTLLTVTSPVQLTTVNVSSEFQRPHNKNNKAQICIHCIATTNNEDVSPVIHPPTPSHS